MCGEAAASVSVCPARLLVTGSKTDIVEMLLSSGVGIQFSLLGTDGQSKSTGDLWRGRG